MSDSPAALPTVCLMIMSGPDDGQVITLEQPKRGSAYFLGRSSDCDAQIPSDPQISRCHASLYQLGSVWYLRDLASRNHTYLGTQLLEGAAPIPPGQMFCLARTWLRFQPGSPG